MIRFPEEVKLKTIKYPLSQRILTPFQTTRRISGRLLLLLTLVLLAAGCTSASVAGSWAGLSADEGGLVLVNINRVTRLNDVGTARWEFPSAGDQSQAMQFYAPPALTEDVVYVGGFDHKVYALDHENGLEIWVSDDLGDRIIGGVVVDQGKVIVPVGGGGVVALNQRNGLQEWFFETPQGIWATPLVVDDVVFAVSMGHQIYALDLDTGELLWEQSLDGAIGSKPIYVDGVLYAGTFGHKLFAVSATSGEILKTVDANNWVWGTSALAEDNILYFADMSGFVYAVEADTFDPVWQRQIASDGVRAAPLVAGDLLVVGSQDGRVYALDRHNGASVWVQITGGEVLSDPVLIDDNVVVISTVGEKQVIAYDLDDAGQELWTYPPVDTTN